MGRWSLRVRSRRRVAVVVGGLLVVAFAALSVVLFVVPTRNAPTHVDAIVVIGGADYAPIRAGFELARQGYAPVVAVSTREPVHCAVPEPGFRKLCFAPTPFSTRGEAAETARLARRYGWHRILVITSTDHVLRTRLRFDRCLPGSVGVRAVAPPAHQWPRRIAYEWGALVKALVFQRGC